MSKQMSSNVGSNLTETIVGNDDVGTAIVEAVAKRSGVPTTGVEERLYDAIDTDALEAFVASAGGADAASVRVSFAYAGFDVTVDGDGTVTIADT